MSTHNHSEIILKSKHVIIIFHCILKQSFCCYIFSTYLAWRSFGMPFSAYFFISIHHLLTCMLLLFLPLSSLAFSWLFWSRWVSCGFQKGQKGQPYCSFEDRRWDKCMLPPVIAAPCQHHWCHCTHASSPHPLSLMHCFLLRKHTPKCTSGWANF